ncbi:hypothetical protein ACH492_00310 [Streptomyces sp. NPDC019443]|uniref:hypothetical protein n=1 Tax=Streptomyces sp. NPDC019443 TaxID=3365061 RepID=UPI00379E34C7
MADVVCVTSPALVFRALQVRQGRQPDGRDHLSQSWRGIRTRWPLLASVNNVRSSSLGVTSFGQSGTIEDLYRFHGLDTDSITGAALDLID